MRAGSKDCFTFITISISGVKMRLAETPIKALLHVFDHPKFGFLEIGFVVFVNTQTTCIRLTRHAHRF